MYKLKLDLDTLRVETFAVCPGNDDAGTVLAHQSADSCVNSCRTCVSCPAQKCG